MNTKKERQKEGFLWKAFWAASHYIIIPRSVKSLVAIFLVSQLGFPLSSVMFPTAQDYLEKNNLDPKIADELSNRKIRVRSRNTPGLVHSFLELPTLYFLPGQRKMLKNPYNAYATMGLSLFGHSTYTVMNMCNVTLPDKEMTTKDMINFMTGIPKEQIERAPVSDRAAFFTIAFHEFRHCDKKNHNNIIPLTEGDADFFALRKAASVFANPEIITTWLHIRAMAFDDSHNTALYLDAKYRGLPLPSEALIHHANKAALVYAQLYLQEEDKRPGYLQYRSAFKMALKRHSHEMSALEIRRTELYIEAAEYFAPTATGVKKPEKQKHINPENGPALT